MSDSALPDRKDAVRHLRSSHQLSAKAGRQATEAREAALHFVAVLKIDYSLSWANVADILGCPQREAESSYRTYREHHTTTQEQ